MEIQKVSIKENLKKEQMEIVDLNKHHKQILKLTEQGQKNEEHIRQH